MLAKKINASTLLMVLLGIMVVMSGIQAIQLTSISSAIYGGAVAASPKASTSTQTTSGITGLNVQSQVGGCG
ncbi:MAG TPA: hypothetical protein VJH34_04155 [archaeon]|nr:hypothetical protein [archaeon]